MEDGVEDCVFEMREGELLLENVSWVSEREGRREKKLWVCEYRRREASVTDLLVE